MDTIGGNSKAGSVQDTIYEFHFEDKKWTEAGKMLNPRHSHAIGIISRAESSLSLSSLLSLLSSAGCNFEIAIIYCDEKLEKECRDATTTATTIRPTTTTKSTTTSTKKPTTFHKSPSTEEPTPKPSTKASTSSSIVIHMISMITLSYYHIFHI